MINPDDMTRFTNNEIVNMYSKLQQDLTKSIISKLKNAGNINSYTRQQIRNLRQIRRK
jgi:curli biogenesis system outer membrane secretion channel CsgG